MEFKDLKAELDNGTVRSFYIFTGEEREVMAKYIKRISPDPQKASSLTSIIGKLTSRGLFSSKSTFVIHNDKSIFEQPLSTILKAVGSNTVILVYDSIDGRVKFFKDAKNYIVDFKRFTEAQLIFHVQKMLDVPDNVAMEINRCCGNDVARIEMECHKLKHLQHPITLEVVYDLVTPPIEDEIFRMIECVAKRDRETAWFLYTNLKELKESPIKIISILYGKFREVFLVQSYSNLQNNEIASKTGLTPWLVGKAREVAGVFTLHQLVKNLQAIQRVEVAVKTGRVDQELGLENLLIKLLR